MSERDRVLAYVAALVAAFVLSLLIGRVAAPYVGGPEPAEQHRSPAAVEHAEWIAR